ncbi:MAG TPA: hypothetical protein VFB96_12770 [Pirellulaceae bacterium]|nr:hypothetical protein [Pirellulaceae bacterium]
MHRNAWLAVICIVLVLVVAPVVGSLVLGPVNRAAGRLKAPTRFLLPDFMWLLVQLQLALGYCVTFVGVQQRYFFPLVLGFFALASVMMWAGAVSFLSRAGVRSNLRRGVFILLLLPLTLALMIATPLLPVVSYLLHTEAEEIEQLFRLKDYLPPNAGVLLLAAGVFCIPILGLALHMLSRWMVAGMQPALPPALVKQSVV